MTPLANYTPAAEAKPPDWLPEALRRYFAPEAPADRLSVAGDYCESELWMLEKHVKDMVDGRADFVIAPMGACGGVGTYRLAPEPPTTARQ